jgi:hypothetical protein
MEVHLQVTTVLAWENTVVMVGQEEHLTSMKKELGFCTKRLSLCCFFSKAAGGQEFKAITSKALTNLTRSNLLTINFDNRKQAFSTRVTIRDQTSSPERVSVAILNPGHYIYQRL